MDIWKVIVDYDASRPIEAQDAIDQRIDGLSESAGTVVDSGAGSGFGRRDLDFSYETEAEATALKAAIESAFAERDDLDLSVRAVELNEG